MPVFVLHQPVESREPFIKVENQLAPGVHHFSLVVEDERGRRSAQNIKAVTVIQSPPPAQSTQATQPTHAVQPAHATQPTHAAQPAHATQPSQAAQPVHPSHPSDPPRRGRH